MLRAITQARHSVVWQVEAEPNSDVSRTAASRADAQRSKQTSPLKCQHYWARALAICAAQCEL